MVKVLAFYFLLLVAPAFAWSALPEQPGLYSFDTPQQSTQYQHLLHELRCLVCQNQDLADSHASLAEDLRQEVYHLVQKHHTDEEILNFLTNRYGDFIRYNPPFKLMTLFLWLAPILMVIISLVLFSLTFKRTHK